MAVGAPDGPAQIAHPSGVRLTRLQWGSDEHWRAGLEQSDEMALDEAGLRVFREQVDMFEEGDELRVEPLEFRTL